MQGLTRSSYALEYAGRRLPLPVGECVVGRADEADIVVDNALISRRHARFTVMDGVVFVEDLGSINGVRVDGKPVQGKMPLAAGSRVLIADVPMTLIRTESGRAGRDTARIDTRDAEYPPRPGSGDRPSARAEVDDTRRVHAFKLIAGVLDKALALGQPDEAERISGGMLQDVLQEAQKSGKIPREIAEAAAQCALKLAGATGRSQWVDYPVRLYSALGRILPLTIIDGLYTVGRHGRADHALLSRYVDKLATLQLAPAERFALQRLQSLVRMAAAGGR